MAGTLWFSYEWKLNGILIVTLIGGSTQVISHMEPTISITTDRVVFSNDGHSIQCNSAPKTALHCAVRCGSTSAVLLTVAVTSRRSVLSTHQHRSHTASL